MRYFKDGLEIRNDFQPQGASILRVSYRNTEKFDCVVATLTLGMKDHKIENGFLKVGTCRFEIAKLSWFRDEHVLHCLLPSLN